MIARVHGIATKSPLTIAIGKEAFIAKSNWISRPLTTMPARS